ncbi:DUF7147 family protein [Bacillus marinisedimentorum]|uniref:DUF7147 family protein n=1 Tax=Bacillus marinisedimentorum TaxID=1821260 RepID=UPI000872C665|nr:methylthioribose kinase [Bacillus marinisedimentorum]
MIQRFIELGEGYSDLYELLEIARSRPDKVTHFLILKSRSDNRAAVSAAVVLKPVKPGDFQPLYICREGIPLKENKSERQQMVEEAASELGARLVEMEIKPSSEFNEKELFYQYVIGILRLHHIIPPLQ